MRLHILLLTVLFAVTISTGCLETGSASSDDLALAREYMLNRDFMEAEKSFERYLRRNPTGEDRWEVWNSLVDLALNVRHDRNAAIELLRAMQQEYQFHPEYKRSVLNKLAHQYELARHFDGSVELWGALVKDPETPELQKASCLRNLARIYLRRLEFEPAKEVLTMCMELSITQSAKSDCQYDLADLYMIMEDMDAGIKELRNLLEQQGVDDDKRVLAIFMLADALEQQGNRDSALGLFETIRYSYPNPRVVEARIEYLKKQKK
ncbi:tetratricopeptide repeat protein [Desulfovibrio sp. OttesenSCG-928-F07]|nr:tetratricopeptide repeat protein [Desulfovibrio sp. OttesenSCG-928-F07]